VFPLLGLKTHKYLDVLNGYEIAKTVTKSNTSNLVSFTWLAVLVTVLNSMPYDHGMYPTILGQGAYAPRSLELVEVRPMFSHNYGREHKESH